MALVCKEKVAAAVTWPRPVAPFERMMVVFRCTPLTPSSKQFQDRLAQAVASHIKRASFDLVTQSRRNPHGAEDGSMKVFDDHRLVNRLAWAFVRRPAMEVASLHASAEHQHAPGIGEMPVHAVVLQLRDHIGHGHLILYFVVRLPFY